MYQIANESIENRQALFRNTAVKMGIREAIIEKDFWVCFLLELLFHQSPYADHLCLKGGTSLSKGYSVIDRFSEDIDLILDWRLLGYSQDEPWKPRSNTKQEIFDEEMNGKTEIYLADVFMPSLERLVKEHVEELIRFSIRGDRQTIRFAYPNLFQDSYVVQEIRLEIGALAAWTPFKEIAVQPYIVDYYPDAFRKSETTIRMVEAKRTFWEKATILHREANRTDSALPARYSRHYYDLYMLSRTPVKQEAFEDLDLLSEVVQFKDKFYHCSWARYDEATPDRMKLVPSGETTALLREDYDLMQTMIFGKHVAFGDIMEGLQHLEAELRTIPH